MKQETKDLIAKRLVTFYKNQLPVEKTERANKISKTMIKYHENMTPEEKINFKKNMVLGKKNMTPEEKALIAEKNRETALEMWENMTPEEMTERSEKLSEGIARNWLIIHPNGHKEYIKNLFQYCKANGLSTSKMSEVASGSRGHHKKYKCRKLS